MHCKVQLILKIKILNVLNGVMLDFLILKMKHTERIKKQDKKVASTLDYRGINFPMKARDYEITEERFEINVNVFGYENKVFPLYVSQQSI